MNKKVLLALKILLPMLVVAMAAMIVLQFTSFQLHGSGEENDLGTALSYVFLILFNIIPSIGMVIIGAVLILLTILLLAVRKKAGTTIATLVFLFLLLPFVGFSAYLDIAVLYMYIEMPIVAALVVVLNLTTIVLSCIAIHTHRKAKKREKLEEIQRREMQSDGGQADEFHV